MLVAPVVANDDEVIQYLDILEDYDLLVSDDYENIEELEELEGESDED